ncbi:MAG: response regulator, partial [Natronospirillum sp.]
MSETQHTVLLVDYDAANRKRIGGYLATRGFVVHEEKDGQEALRRVATERPDIVVSAVNLPGEDGLTLCKLCRKYFNGPLVLMAERADELDQVLGLDMGADDYVKSTVSPRLLAARINAVLRRLTVQREATRYVHERLNFGDLIIDNTMREAWLNHDTIELTSAEFDLLWLLCSHAGKILTREEIFTRLRGIEYDGQDRS